MSNFLIFLFGLCWGSFLNVLAFRLLNKQDWIKTRSFCPKCKKTLYWYDLFPIISWIILKAKCRFCKKPISWLYPFIELLSGILAVLLYTQVPLEYFGAYFLFFSALIITIRSDLEAFVIFFSMTWALVPFALLASFCNFLPISFLDSFLGATLGYIFLWTIRKVYFKFTSIEGLGQGDLDLMALIGSFTGAIGVLITLVLGSTLGLLAGIIYFFLFSSKNTTFRKIKIPFGPFLAFGAIIYTLIPQIKSFLFFN